MKNSFLVTTCRIHHSALVYKSFGKPNSFVFKNAETILRQIKASCHDDNGVGNEEMVSLDFKTLYMIGDNPPVDIKGARQVCLCSRFDFHFPITPIFA